MKHTELVKILFCAVVGIHFLGIIIPSHSKEIISQETHGNQSPVAYTEEGNIYITYGMATEMIKILQDYVDSKDTEIEGLKQRLIDIHRSEFDSLPVDAENWAIHFLATMSIRKDRLKDIELSLEQAREDKKLESEKLEKQIEVIFQFLLNAIDLNIQKLNSLGEELKYETDNSYTLFSVKKVENIIRTITFKNGCLLKINLSSGLLKNGLIANCPKLIFIGKWETGAEVFFQVKEPARGITLMPIPPLVPYPEEIKITDVCYTIDGDSIISKEFREQFIKSFDESLGRMYHLCQ